MREIWWKIKIFFLRHERWILTKSLKYPSSAFFFVQSIHLWVFVPLVLFAILYLGVTAYFQFTYSILNNNVVMVMLFTISGPLCVAHYIWFLEWNNILQWNGRLNENAAKHKLVKVTKSLKGLTYA